MVSEKNSPDVVIFDDNASYAAMLKDYLLGVTNSIEAVSKFEQFSEINLQKTKCLILDFYLRETGTKYTETALNVLDEIRGAYPNLKVILHSGQAGDLDIIEADKNGTYLIIPKAEENTPDELRDAVRSIIGPATQEVDDPRQDDEIQHRDGQREIHRLNRVVDRLLKEKEDERILEDSRSQVSESYQQYIEEFQSVIRLVSTISTSGQRAGILLDEILDNLIKHAGAHGGAWFLFSKGQEKARNQNCDKLARERRANVPRSLEKTLGSSVWQALEQDNGANSIIGPLPVASDNGNHGIFQGKVVLCIFEIAVYRDKLLFVLEHPNKPDGAMYADSDLRTYVKVLENILDFLPRYADRGEFGKIDSFVNGCERKVSGWQLISRGIMSLLSLALFISAIISAAVSAFLLFVSVLWPVVEQLLDYAGIHIAAKPNPMDHYGVGIVHALEIFILSITLYLLAIGLSSMIDHPRLNRIPQRLRHLDNPTEMKKSLILAVCTLIAVAGLKFILELDLPNDGDHMEWVKGIVIFGSKVLASVIFLFSLTTLLGHTESRLMASAIAKDD
jgi:hypothetical protein